MFIIDVWLLHVTENETVVAFFYEHGLEFNVNNQVYDSLLQNTNQHTPQQQCFTGVAQ